MKNYLTLLLVMAGLISKTQNLVPNGDFEQHTNCPSTWSDLPYANYWLNPSTWGSPDYFNACDHVGFAGVPDNAKGHQLAHSGGGYCGIHRYWPNGSPPNFREYIEAQLSDTLVQGGIYHFELYMNLRNASMLASPDIGVYFSDTIIDSIHNAIPLPYTPQIQNPLTNFPDTASWTLVSADYTAHGGENYLIIGNFRDNDSTTYTLVNNNGSYWESYVYIDDVSLTLLTITDLPDVRTATVIYPNPFTDEMTIATGAGGLSEVRLYSITGGIILRQNFTGTTTLSTGHLAKGIYFYEVHHADRTIRNGKLIKQ